MEILLWMIYLLAGGAIVWFILGMVYPSKTRYVVVEEPVATWWPWRMSVYNNWPYWSGGYAGGGGGYSSRSPPSFPHHQGSHQPPAHHGETRPWGGPGRTANDGGFHHKGSRGGH